MFTFPCPILHIGQNSSRMGRVFHRGLSVFPDDISKTDAAGITKLDVQMFYDESWKAIYFGVKRAQRLCRSLFRQNAILPVRKALQH